MSDFCSICRQPKVDGKHDISEHEAGKFRKRACERCGQEARVICKLGLGEFIFRCPDGHLKFDTIVS